MENTLKPGMTSLEVHRAFGEPDIRNYVNDRTEIWSYAKHANTGDVTAAVLYTSAKEGDTGVIPRPEVRRRQAGVVERSDPYDAEEGGREFQRGNGRRFAERDGPLLGG